MGTLRAGFGRYELGAKDGDMSLVKHIEKLEKAAGNATDAFRALISRDIEKSKEPAATEQAQ